MIRVTFTGPECTGKTTLSQAVAKELDTTWSPEYARDYVELLRRSLTVMDVEPIAQGQIAALEKAVASARNGVVVHDTDLLSTLVYSRHYYSDIPRWVRDETVRRRADLYLLSLPDENLRWQSDGVRDRGDLRDQLANEFRSALQEIRANVVELTGPWEGRLAAAMAAVRALL